MSFEDMTRIQTAAWFVLMGYINDRMCPQKTMTARQLDKVNLYRTLEKTHPPDFDALRWIEERPVEKRFSRI